MPHYELVVQDGASTDGTREFLQRVEGIPGFTLVSEPDTGIGQAFNRALGRCRGAIIGSIDADNLLQPEALAIAVRRFAEQPEAAAIYGVSRNITPEGALLGCWIPPAFDLLGLLEGAVVPPFAAAFFSRAGCGADLWIDETFPTVGDFDLWLRLAHRPVIRIPDTVVDVRVRPQSSTWTQTAYAQHCHYKILALTRALDGPGREHVVGQLRARAAAGIYLWAVDSLAVIGGGQAAIDEYFGKAQGRTCGRSGSGAWWRAHARAWR